MYCTRKVADDLIWVGADDRRLAMFEGVYSVPRGVSYNSYLLLDEKTVVFDTVDHAVEKTFLENVEHGLNGRTLDYLVVQHMEPDHSATIRTLLMLYPEAEVVCSKKTEGMLRQFFGDAVKMNIKVVGEGDTLRTGKHEFTFLAAPMVHWPEVMMTYESTEKILFSADAFGKFGARDTDEDWACEARRYYFGIVGKYGTQVQAVLKKAKDLYIEKICPLHGPILEEDLGYYIDLYDKWSGYRPETEGVCICYTSVYGNTKKAAELLRDELAENGVETIEMSDLARCDMAEAVEDAFRYDRLVLATTTYNGGMFPFMQQFIDELTERNFQNRYVGFIENGSWGPAAMRAMKKELEGAKNIKIAENNVTIKSKLNDASRGQIEALAKELTPGHMDLAAELAEPAEKKTEEGKKKGFVCNICGYVYEGDTLPDDFVCPLCKHPASDFSPL